MLSGMALGRFRDVFDSRHVVLPVIHVRDREQALANAQLARDAGADGIFLINHDLSVAKLLEIHAEVAASFRRWFVGVNCLGLPARDCFARLSPAVAGLWVDDAQIDEHKPVQIDASAIDEARRASGWSGLYFGGVAFKYRRPVEAVQAAARAARDHMDIVTTSGPGTGAAAAVDKIQSMKAALDRFPLAVASGITPENVGAYLPHADCFLVATGISRSFHDLDQKRLARLVAEVRAADGESRCLTASHYGFSSKRAEGHFGHRIVMTDLSRGPEFAIDTACFPEPEPMFAYCDDVGSCVDQLEGLEEAGNIEFERESYMWLKETRSCRLLRATRRTDGNIVRFRSCGVGEFCLEVYYIPGYIPGYVPGRAPSDGGPQLLWRDDFCLK